MLPLKKFNRSLIVACLLLCSNVLANTSATDVYNSISQLAADIDLIRLEMGVAEQTQTDIAISGTQPREVYFQALTLHKKSNQLLFENIRERSNTPLPAPANIDPSHVIGIIHDTQLIISRVKQSLNITDTASTHENNTQRTPDDVYKLIIHVNRTLNTLLERHFSPAEVYQQTTYSVGLIATILTTVSAKNRLGTEPNYVHRKTPTQVYRKFIHIYSIIRHIFTTSGEKCLLISDSELKREDISPSDVYDLASLLVSELEYLHNQAPNTSVAKPSYYPGNKLPSNVFQRAGRLESQLITLKNYVTENKNWLEKPQ